MEHHDQILEALKRIEANQVKALQTQQEHVALAKAQLERSEKNGERECRAAEAGSRPPGASDPDRAASHRAVDRSARLPAGEVAHPLGVFRRAVRRFARTDRAQTALPWLGAGVAEI